MWSWWKGEVEPVLRREPERDPVRLLAVVRAAD
jgi:hypothetical protein